jgi:hypothetical protein
MLDWLLDSGMVLCSDDSVLAAMTSRTPFEVIEKDTMGLSILSIHQNLLPFSKMAEIESV